MRRLKLRNKDKTKTRGLQKTRRSSGSVIPTVERPPRAPLVISTLA